MNASDAENAPLPTLQDESVVEVSVSGSETDYSDFEGGGEKETTLMARVRQCSLQAINAVIDVSCVLTVFSFMILFIYSPLFNIQSLN